MKDMQENKELNNQIKELSDDDLDNVVGGFYMQTIANLAAKFIKDKIGDFVSNKGIFKTAEKEEEER